VVQSRDVINRFVRTGCVNKGKSTGRPPISEKVVGDLRERLEHNPDTFGHIWILKFHVFKRPFDDMEELQGEITRCCRCFSLSVIFQ
jgi:hypothetical protein